MDNTSREVGKIYETTNYEQFKFMNENRRVSPRNYAKLLSSMKEEQLRIPILVNSKYEIVDGQHRYLCARELGYPILYYIVENYGIEQVKRANMVMSTWQKEDFLHLHLENGNNHYVDFYRLKERYGISISDLIKVFAIVQQQNQKLMRKYFEEGSFTSEGKEYVENFLIALNDFSFFKQYRMKQFFGAFIKLYFHIDYDHSRMLDRLKHRSFCFTYKSTTDDYLLMLTKDVYSFGATKNPLYYDTQTKKFYSANR